MYGGGEKCGIDDILLEGPSCVEGLDGGIDMLCDLRLLLLLLLLYSAQECCSAVAPTHSVVPVDPGEDDAKADDRGDKGGDTGEKVGDEASSDDIQRSESVVVDTEMPRASIS